MDETTLLLHGAFIVGGLLALHVFYRAIQTEWPRAYMSASDFTGLFVSKSFARYAVYRAAPVAAVTFLVAGSLRNSGEPAAPAAMTVAVLHVATTNGYATWEAVRRGRTRFAFASTLLFHAVASVGTVFGGFVGIAGAHWSATRHLLPSPDALVAGLWTALAAAILGAYLVRAVSHEHSHPLEHARHTIPDHLWTAARTHALANGSDPALVKAILLVENLQRPRWLRRIENIKGALGLKGTYGIMQVTSNSLIDDETSIKLACEGHLARARPQRNEDGDADRDAVQAAATRHNRDPAFTNLVAEAFLRIDHEEAEHRARLTLSRTASGLSVLNSGGSPATDIKVLRVRIDASETLYEVAHVPHLDPGGRAEVTSFERTHSQTLPNLDLASVLMLTTGDALVRVVWRTEVGVSGSSRWELSSRLQA